MHPLLGDSIQALDDPSFRDLFHRFLVLQRYDLTPYVHLFGTLPDDEKSRHGTLSVGSAEISANELVSRFINMLTAFPRSRELAALAAAFWKAFPNVVANQGPRECVTARRTLESDYEQHFMMPLLRTQVCGLAPRRVLDFGCGLNRLGPAIQQALRGIGAVAPTIIGVDVQLSKDAIADPQRGIQLYDIHDRPLSSVLDAPVDLAIAKYVMHHMTEAAQRNVMSALAEVLAPQGRLLVLEASVNTDGTDLESFAECQRSHVAWPKAGWAEPYRAWSQRFYGCDGPSQRMLMCLEDTFGHVFLPGPSREGTPMPLPYTYVDRQTVTQLARDVGLEPDSDLSAVLGLPPCLKYGPPSSLLAFRRSPS